MKKRKRLRLVIAFWLTSVCCMILLLVMSFLTYGQLNTEVKQMKQMQQELILLQQKRQQNSADKVIAVLKEDTEEGLKSTKETEQHKEVSLSGNNLSEDENIAEIDIEEEPVEVLGDVGAKFDEQDNVDVYESIVGQEPVEEVKLLFAGDLLLSGAILRQYDKTEGQITGLSEEGLLNVMNEADIFMVNQEFPFSDRGEAMKNKQYTFRTSTDRIHILHELGIDIVSLANNHALDYGMEALADTCTTLDEADIMYVGAGENLERAKALQIIEAGGKKIGFLAASRVIPVTGWNATENKAGMLTTYNPEKLLTEIELADSECDYLVVYVHWGLEHHDTPEEYQVTMAKQYIDAGADAVIGSHPHVVQGVSYYKDKIIAYSLGNFIFGNTIKQGMMMELTLSDEEVKAELVPFYSPGFTLKEMSEEKKQEFYNYITEISIDARVDENGVILPLQ